MKWRWLRCLLCLIAVSLLTLAPAVSAAKTGWVAGGEIAAVTLYRDGERQTVFDAQQRAHLNTLFVTVKQFDGKLWYFSRRFPELMAFPGPGLTYAPNDNPLIKIVDSARTAKPRQGVVVLFQAFNDRYAARTKFPEARIGSLDWVDPAYRPMQDYLIDIASELVATYPIDGISLDMVRYPTGVSNASLPFTGGRSRTDIITDFVARFAAQVHEIDPSIEVSANVFGDTTRRVQHEVGQDITALSPHLDYVMPMLYPYTDHRDGDQDMLYRYQKERVASGVDKVDPDKIKPDIQAFFGYTWNDVKAQVQGVREGGGTGAFIYAYDFDMGWDPEGWASLANVMPTAWQRTRFRVDEAGPTLEDVDVIGRTLVWQSHEPALAQVVVWGAWERWQSSTTVLSRTGSTALGKLQPGRNYRYSLTLTDSLGNRTVREGQFQYAPVQRVPGITAIHAPVLNDVWAVLAWETPVPTGAKVSYRPVGAPASQSRTLRLDRFVHRHELRLTDLSGGKTYEIELTAVDGEGHEVGKHLRIVTPDNIAQGRKVMASSVIHSGFEGTRATDGDLETRWSSEYRDLQSLTVDLGGSHRIQGIGLEWEYAYAQHYRIMISTDGSHWTTLVDQQDGQGGREDAWFSPITARYVRVFCRKRGTALGNSLWEFKVFSKPGELEVLP